MQVPALLDNIDRGGLSLPMFQRGYVWTRPQVKKLMQSLYCGYPVGGCVAASIGCSFSGVGLRLQNHYPRFTGASPCRFRTLTQRPPSVDSVLTKNKPFRCAVPIRGWRGIVSKGVTARFLVCRY